MMNSGVCRSEVELTEMSRTTQWQSKAEFTPCFEREVELNDRRNNSDQIPGDAGADPLRAKKPAEALNAEASRHSNADFLTPGRDLMLSADERRIIASIVAGYSKKDIAREFSLSESTIYRRTAHIIEKLGVANKFELMLFAIYRGIVDGGPRNSPNA